LGEFFDQLIMGAQDTDIAAFVARYEPSHSFLIAFRWNGHPAEGGAHAGKDLNFDGSPLRPCAASASHWLLVRIGNLRIAKWPSFSIGNRARGIISSM